MKTCCQTADIFTTLGDVRRIEDFTGETGFTEYRAPVNPAYADQDDDPVWRDNVFRPDGTRRVVKKQPNGDCTFLGSAGCVLPLETRPLICRIYPFDYTAEGILDELSEGCPTELLKPGQGLIEALDMKRSDAERWHRQLYAELQQESVAVPAYAGEMPNESA
jgi:Fe-S-cluster containining protein